MITCYKCRKSHRSVCHHCGRPLCVAPQADARESTCGWYVPDPALVASDDDRVQAAHCEECLSQYHKVEAKTLLAKRA